MKEVEVKLVKGASFITHEGKLKFIKGQTRFIEPELAKKLVSTQRFAYTAEERGKDKILCPFCKKTFDLSKEFIIRAEQEESADGVITMEQVKKPETKAEFVCQHCLRTDFISEHGLKIHLAKCEYNPKNSKKNPLQSKEEDK